MSELKLISLGKNLKGQQLPYINPKFVSSLLPVGANSTHVIMSDGSSHKITNTPVEDVVKMLNGEITSAVRTETKTVVKEKPAPQMAPDDEGPHSAPKQMTAEELILKFKGKNKAQIIDMVFDAVGIELDDNLRVTDWEEQLRQQLT